MYKRYQQNLVKLYRNYKVDNFELNKLKISLR